MAKHIDKNIYLEWEEEPLILSNPNQQENTFFVRTGASKEEIEAAFYHVEYVDAGIPDEIGFITVKMTEADFARKLESVSDVRQTLRLAD
jgi:homoserine dehydrogenase